MTAPKITQPIICPACRKENSPQARFCQHCGHDVVLNNTGPRYFLTRAIKAGGQGAVYEARGEDGQRYAVKEMLDSFTDPAERMAAVRRFEAEAELLRSLNDPRIPRVYASFHDEGRHYLVMEFISGEDLDELVSREGAQPEARVLVWADAICDVLDHLHAQGIVYRDMKPGNLMIEQASGALKLIDFGIAKLFQATARGTQIGTPGYAPPEQYQGLATPVSDVYALGATLHHLLTGRDPQKHAPFNFPPLRDLVPTLAPRTEAAVARALEMRPEDRFASMDAFRAALRPAAPAQVIRATTPAAAASAQAATPTKPAPAPVKPAPAPVKPAPAPAKPASAPAAPAPAPAKPASAAATPAGGRQGGRLLAVVGGLIVLLALAAVAVFFFLPGQQAPAGLPATPQVLVARPFTVTDLEILVPSGSNDAAINQAFAAAFLELAKQDCACQAQIQSGTLVFLTGAEPRQAGIGPDGTRYRASLTATLLVPEE